MLVVFKEYHTVHIDKEKGQDKPDLFSARDDILSSMLSLSHSSLT